MPTTYHAESLREFVTRIEQIKTEWESKKDGEAELWYRGLRNACWPLIPKLYRHRDPIKELLESEDEIREEFVRRAPSLTAHKPENAWEWYFLMQHYAAPTRLLDWTENPLVGLYFAVKDNEGLHDAAVWALDPWQLNKLVVKKYEVMPPGAAGLSRTDARRYRPWLPDRFDAKERLKKQHPVAIYPNQFDRRIAAQRSCFTVHGLQKKSLEQQFDRPERLLAKIVIPAYASEDVRDELVGDYGVDEASIFPDLEGLGKSVAGWVHEERAAPHSGLYTRLQPSSIHGVGVFAIKRIKKRTPIFSGDSDELRWVKVQDLPKEKAIRKLYDDFAIIRIGAGDRPTRYGCHQNFHRLSISWYINDPKPGDKPNVICDPDNYEFRALRDIEPGEELTVDSNTYSDHGKLKPARFQKRRVE